MEAAVTVVKTSHMYPDYMYMSSLAGFYHRMLTRIVMFCSPFF
jgi:hypothetical protein